MHRFFVLPENIEDTRAYIDEDEARHIEKVLRLKRGDMVRLFDGSGREYEARLGGRDGGRLWADIEAVHDADNAPGQRLILLQGVLKGERMDMAVQKAVEIGVSAIQPFFSARTVVQLTPERAGQKQRRWQLIAREACKQCRMNRIPEVSVPRTYSELVPELADKKVIMLYEGEKTVRLRHLMAKSEFRQGDDIYMLIGPEGGFAPEEVELGINHGFMVASLGPRILRSDTASLIGAGMILYSIGELG